MRSTTLLLLPPLIAIAGCGRHRGVSASDDVDAPFAIAGYLPDYRAYVDINAAATSLTDLLAFSLTPDAVLRYPSSSGGCCLASAHYDKLRQARSHGRAQRDQPLRLLATVGGGGRSEGFREVATGNADLQRRFVDNLVQLCRDEELDGIDLDFEGIQSLEDFEAYQQFMMTAAAHLHRHRLLLTVALHPGMLLSPTACRSVDRVHVMTYDMVDDASAGRGESLTLVPGAAAERGHRQHHASLRAAHDALSKFVQHGCPPAKLILGIPAYGRHKDNMGLVKTYSEILDEVLEKTGDGMEVREVVRSLRTWKGYRFDSPDDVGAKVKYAMENGLGGVFLWELGQDKQVAGVAEGVCCWRRRRPSPRVSAASGAAAAATYRERRTAATRRPPP